MSVKILFLVLYCIIIPTKVYMAETEMNQTVEFDRNHMGVLFSPYVKNWENGSDGWTVPSWRNHTLNDMKYMLNLVSTKFQRVSTEGMGVWTANDTWEKGFIIAFTAVVAAQNNAEIVKNSFNRTRTLNNTLSVDIGIWHSHQPGTLKQELINAVTAGREANHIYPNTVWGVSLTSQSSMGYRTWKDAIEFLNGNRLPVTQMGFKFGIRLDICDQAVVKKRPEAENNIFSTPIIEPGPGPPSDMELIAKSADYVICTITPSANMVGEGTQSAVNALGHQFLLIENILKEWNTNLSVIWETGWPSSGISGSGSKNTARNLRDFWKGMGDFAKDKNLVVYMLQAFDQPFKTNPSSDKDPTDPEGPNGANSHFGWWTLDLNTNIKSLREKIPEPEPEVPEPPGGISAVQTATIILAILTPLIAILMWRLHKARKTIERLTEDDIKEFVEGMKGGDNATSVDCALHLPYDRSFELSKDGFVIDELSLLGSGAFGTVYKGKIHGIRESVAFKKPNKDISTRQLKNLLTEIKTMIYIGRHENVVVLLGAYTDQIRDGILYIASECCTIRSLESYLRNIPRTFNYVNTSGTEPDGTEVRYVNGNHITRTATEGEMVTKISIMSLIKWSYEIANGMEYLAEKKVIHADLATRNVLLTAEGSAKITDFGLSRRLYEYTEYVKTNKQEPLPWRWMAIESLKNLTFSSLSDVWSYGVTLWEIFSLGDVPYPGLTWDVKFVDQLEEGLRMHKPKYSTDQIYDQMTLCWQLDPESRPKFTELKNYFQTFAYEEGKLGLMETSI